MEDEPKVDVDLARILQVLSDNDDAILSELGVKAAGLCAVDPMLLAAAHCHSGLRIIAKRSTVPEAISAVVGGAAAILREFASGIPNPAPALIPSATWQAAVMLAVMAHPKNPYPTKDDLAEAEEDLEKAMEGLERAREGLDDMNDVARKEFFADPEVPDYIKEIARVMEQCKPGSIKFEAVPAGEKLVD